MNTVTYEQIRYLNLKIDKVWKRVTALENRTDDAKLRVTFPNRDEALAKLRKENAKLAERGDAFSVAADRAEREIESLKEGLARERNKLVQVRDLANAEFVTGYTADRLLDILDAD